MGAFTVRTLARQSTSTLGYVVSYLELLYALEVLGQYTHAVLASFLVAAFCYVIVNNILATVARRLERRTSRAPSTAA